MSDAKNQLRNRSGFSPRQWVFGTNGRQIGDLFDGTNDMASIPVESPDAKFARSTVIKNGARAAFFRCQTKDALDRAILHKPRIQPENYNVGDMVFIYREDAPGQGQETLSCLDWTGRCYRPRRFQLLDGEGRSMPSCSARAHQACRC